MQETLLLDGTCLIDLKLYFRISLVESCQLVYAWVKSEGGGLGGAEFFGPPLQRFTGPLLQNLEYISGMFSSSPVDWHPFIANWVKGGGCGHVQKSEAHTLGCRLRGESSQ